MSRNKTRKQRHYYHHHPKPTIYSNSACAKLNLTLDILGKRDDGYHEVQTVMQTIDLCDKILASPLPNRQNSVEPGTIELHCGRASLQSETNLVVRAAKALQAAICARGGIPKSAQIELRKKIPVAAGLGGGSSDAAATLLALNELWHAGFSVAELEIIAAGLGSDVPFFLYGGTMLAEGRGEKLARLPAPAPLWVVLLRPPIHIPDKTRQLYSNLKPSEFTDGAATRELVSLLTEQQALTPDWWKQWQNGGNSFAHAWDRITPRIAIYRKAMRESGAEIVLLSGAGPTIFTLTSQQAEAESIRNGLRERGMPAFLARFTN